MTIKEHMKRVEKIYKDAAPEYIKVMKQAQTIQQQIDGVRKSGEYTQEGRQKRLDHLKGELSKYQQQMTDISGNAKQKALEIRREVDGKFYRRFHAAPDMLDANAVTLLQSGILTDNELVSLSDSFRDNATMRRIVGKYMSERENDAIRMRGQAMLHSVSDPHLTAIDTIMEIGSYCLGGAPMSGPEGAETFLNRFDEMADEAYTSAPDVSD